MIEAHTVLILFFDNPLQRMLHAEELLFRQVTFEHAELDALTKIFQGLVDTVPALIVMDVIRHDKVHVQSFFENHNTGVRAFSRQAPDQSESHLVINGGYTSSSPWRNFPSSLACSSKQR